ncbi:hypothetical protein [Kibdelosporangium phytohabitans]|uniref:hypothetical protein n=1 Tax=Kibdelosporangium phytohabitans TaxID=860235 RepID=UPI0014700DDC|nr:hypothetical protein [Kibdelosporangium phytohabitans]MBE1471396.1 hypothetical protein [Kibdelosporangium phytohabitans]
MKRRSINADEQDVHSRWRRYLTSFRRAGAASKVKRRIRRRERREGKHGTRRAQQEG